MANAREARVKAGLSMERMAAFAGVSGPTIRMFEANPASVSPFMREKLNAFYLQFYETKREEPVSLQGALMVLDRVVRAHDSLSRNRTRADLDAFLDAIAKARKTLLDAGRAA